LLEAGLWTAPWLGAAALLLTALISCRASRESEHETYADLVAAFPAATVVYDARIPDLGKSDSDVGGLEGFSRVRRDESRDRTFVWSNRGRSRAPFDLLAVRPVTLTLEARASRSQGGRDQTVEVVLNGEPVGDVVISRNLSVQRLSLPQHALRTGSNELEFLYRNTGRGTAEHTARSRAIAWYQISVAAQESSDAAASSERELLFLPFGSEVSYFVELRPGTHWAADRIAFRDADAGRLEVLVEFDDGGVKELAVPDGESEQVDVGLDQLASEPARVVLRATGSSGDPQAGIVIFGPRLTAPAEAQARIELHPAKERPNIIFYLVDTLRVDRLGCYGYEKPISTHVDAFAESAVVFERAVGQSSWTRSSVASLFTGQWPVSHGAIGRRDRLSEDAFTLAEGLSEIGYSSAGFVTNANVDAKFGIGQGFDSYKQIHEFTRSQQVTERVLHWLKEEKGEDPFFLYIHTIDPHDRYTPSPEFLEQFASGSVEFYKRYRRRHPDTKPAKRGARDHLQALYDAEIAENDESFGNLIRGLSEMGLYEDSLIVFLSDHGEEFFEHREFTHGKNLFATTLDFPLIVKFPGQRTGVRTSRLVQHADLLPTVFELAGLEIPASVEGRSFADLAGGRDEREVKGPVFSHLHLDMHPQASIVDGDWKLIHVDVADGPRRVQLFNLATDPDEKENLAIRHPIRAAVMGSQLQAHIAASQARSRREEIVLDEELERSLRALGYLQ
jgi:arylsulfatase A-like enzyme